MLKCLTITTAAIFLSACGVETLSAAATSAVVKKEEMQERQKQYNRAQERINQAQEQMAAKDRAARDALGMTEKTQDDNNW